MLSSSHARAFVDDVLAWLRHSDSLRLLRVLRSPFSGVPHDAGAAYATLGERIGPLLEAIERERLTLPPDERTATLLFAERLRKLAAAAPPENDADVRESIAATFGLGAIEDEARAPAAALALALSDSVSPDPPSGVRARAQHFSASALNAYAECARKWYYRYVCSAVEDRGSSASYYGTAFHLALEDFHAEFPQPNRTDEAEMRAKIKSYIHWAFERHRDDFDSAVEIELQQRRAQRTAQRYVDWLIAESDRAPFSVVGREIAANLELGGFPFVGFIDRLDLDERTGTVSVIDYKTGAIAESAAEYRDKVKQNRDFQLPFYYWARTAAGDRVSKLILLPLKDALLDVTPIVLEVVPGPVTAGRRNDAPIGTIGIDDLERARARIIEICGELTLGDLTTFPVTNDPSACTYCAYKTACIDRPAAERDKFGR